MKLQSWPRRCSFSDPESAISASPIAPASSIAPASPKLLASLIGQQKVQALGSLAQRYSCFLSLGTTPSSFSSLSLSPPLLLLSNTSVTSSLYEFPLCEIPKVVSVFLTAPRLIKYLFRKQALPVGSL